MIKFAVQALRFKRQGKNNGSVVKNKNLGSQKLSLRVMQNMYSPNRFYITFPHDNSWNFLKIWDLIKKLIRTFLYNIWFFLFFGWLKLTPLFKIMWNLFISTVNKCAITIMIIIMIDVKSFLERHFRGISKINLLLWKKLYCIQPLSCAAKLDKHYGIYLVLTKEIPQKWPLCQDLLKSISKDWKPSCDWMTWCRQQSENINYIGMEDLDLWQILAKFLPKLISSKH